MANEVVLTDTTLYRVVKNQPVRLSVTIGDDQVGGTALHWEGRPHPFDNQQQKAVIGGDGQDVTGTILHCSTVVNDQNPATNKTSVTYTLEGGHETKQYPYAVEVRVDKGNAHYLVTFVFTA